MEVIDKLNHIGLDSDQKWAVAAVIEEYASKLHLLQQEYDKLKGENEELNAALMNDAVALEYGFEAASYSDLVKQHAALKEEYDKLKMQSELNYEVLVSEYNVLKGKAEEMAAVLRNIKPYLSAPGTNGNHWLPEVDAALSSYNSNTNNQNENNG